MRAYPRCSARLDRRGHVLHSETLSFYLCGEGLRHLRPAGCGTACPAANPCHGFLFSLRLLKTKPLPQNPQILSPFQPLQDRWCPANMAGCAYAYFDDIPASGLEVELGVERSHSIDLGQGEVEPLRDDAHQYLPADNPTRLAHPGAGDPTYPSGAHIEPTEAQFLRPRHCT